MDSANYRVRRATLDDIGALSALWQTMRFPVEDLGKRITEFQVAEGGEGKILGAIGLQIAERQGRIHSEAFTDFSLADRLRPLFWERLQSIATNHGLLRLWTCEEAPFWTHCGLVKADPEVLAKLPAPWRSAAPNWLTLKLKDDIQAVLSADKEFEMFMASERERTQRALKHARILKLLATLLAVAIFGLICVGAFFVLRHNPQLLRR
jgi:N-acetylglutamate synthase-like GNAT family acetyltransferase